MKQYSQMEQDNVNYLISHNIQFAVVKLTHNILSHAIFDANSELRRVLKVKGVHDFSTQQNGVENKVMVNTHILTFAREILSSSSLYRSNTRGDERMWPGSAIFPVVEDDNIIAVIPYNKEIYIINISKVDLGMSVNTFIDNPIKALINAYKRGETTLFNYERCFANYAEQIVNLRQAKIRGEVIVAKPVLLLSVIDGVEMEKIRINRIELDEWLEGRFNALMQQYTKKSQFDGFSPINNPFWHLQSDGFWHLCCSETPEIGVTPTTTWLKEKVSYAYVDDDLWTLLQNKEWRLRLHNFIVEHKLAE